MAEDPDFSPSLGGAGNTIIRATDVVLGGVHGVKNIEASYKNLTTPVEGLFQAVEDKATDHPGYVSIDAQQMPEEARNRLTAIFSDQGVIPPGTTIENVRVDTTVGEQTNLVFMKLNIPGLDRNALRGDPALVLNISREDNNGEVSYFPILTFQILDKTGGRPVSLSALLPKYKDLGYQADALRLANAQVTKLAEKRNPRAYETISIIKDIVQEAQI